MVQFQEEIIKILTENGWEHTRKVELGKGLGEMDLFTKEHPGIEIGIEVALLPDSYCCYGWYGVCGVHINKCDFGFPYLRDDLIEMQEAISNAEVELLKIGVPFRPTYAFATYTEHNLGENLRLRKEHRLELYEYKTETGGYDDLP